MANPVDSQSADAQIADLVEYLEHHDISVSRQIATADENEGNILGALARKHDSNLIIAGAYGRTRLSEWIFGGVTRHLLLTSPVPCLFSN
jgi:nucleotide-binding universal stress UspA family protein